MADFHVRLVLDYVQARARADRTEAVLAGIVQHVSDTYCLGATERAEVAHAALTLARQRGLLGPA